MKLKTNKTSEGFTLVEIIIVIAITLVLTAAATPLYTGLHVSSQLNENSSQVTQTIRTARERSIAGLNNAQHGVYFEINASAQDRFILYQGSSYGARNPLYDRAVKLSEALSLSTTLVGSEVVFSKGLGKPNVTGTVTLTHDVQGARIISINSLGKIEED